MKNSYKAHGYMWQPSMALSKPGDPKNGDVLFLPCQIQGFFLFFLKFSKNEVESGKPGLSSLWSCVWLPRYILFFLCKLTNTSLHCQFFEKMEIHRLSKRIILSYKNSCWKNGTTQDWLWPVSGSV